MGMRGVVCVLLDLRVPTLAFAHFKTSFNCQQYPPSVACRDSLPPAITPSP